MPQTNTEKEYAPYSYYHVFTRGINKQKIFLEAKDYHYFIRLFERYLSDKPALSKTGVPYPNYRNDIEVLAYCLMKNHLHMLVYQHEDPQAIVKLMSSLKTSYSKYYNLKYGHRGTIFESRYKAKMVKNEMYFAHIARYIHTNPRRWLTYSHSSLRYVFNNAPPNWLRIERITGGFKDRAEYINFLQDYQADKDALKEIKDDLAEI